MGDSMKECEAELLVLIRVKSFYTLKNKFGNL